MVEIMTDKKRTKYYDIINYDQYFPVFAGWSIEDMKTLQLGPRIIFLGFFKVFYKNFLDNIVQLTLKVK